MLNFILGYKAKFYLQSETKDGEHLPYCVMVHFDSDELIPNTLYWYSWLPRQYIGILTFEDVNDADGKPIEFNWVRLIGNSLFVQPKRKIN